MAPDMDHIKYTDHIKHASLYPAEQKHESFVSLSEQANANLGEMLHRLSALADKLCGGIPEGTVEVLGQSGISAGPCGLFDAAADNGRQMLAKIDRGNKLLQRIESRL